MAEQKIRTIGVRDGLWIIRQIIVSYNFRRVSMRIDHMIYFGLVVVSLMLTACGGGGDDEPPAEVTINSASHSGEGCPAGTGDITLSADKKTVSVLFDGYEAEAGAGTGPVGQPGLTTKRVACNLAVSLNIPAGYQAFLIGADFRGAVSLPKDAIAEFSREYFFAAESSPILTETWSGELDNDDIEIFDDLYASSDTQSACGQDVILRSNTSLYVTAPAAGDTALIQMDSFDYQNQQDRTQFDYQFSYVRCS